MILATIGLAALLFFLPIALSILGPSRRVSSTRSGRRTLCVHSPNPFIRGVRFSLATGLHVLAAHDGAIYDRCGMCVTTLNALPPVNRRARRSARRPRGLQLAGVERRRVTEDERAAILQVYVPRVDND